MPRLTVRSLGIVAAAVVELLRPVGIIWAWALAVMAIAVAMERRRLAA